MNSHASVTKDSISIRFLDKSQEFDACVDLQQSVWQFREIDAVPRRIFVVTRSIGGQVIGAFAGEQLAGFAMAIPGMRNGHPYLHSHMLAVRPQFRNRGIGAQLKWAQRDDALARGIDLIEWTFDPLAIKNAYMNIEKLGVVIRRYTPDFYGVSSSPLHGSLPTDRLHAEWWLRSERVQRLSTLLPLSSYSAFVTIRVTNDAKHESSKQSFDGALMQLQLRREFSQAFKENLAVLRFQMQRDNSGIYQLGRWEENWNY